MGRSAHFEPALAARRAWRNIGCAAGPRCSPWSCVLSRPC